MKTGWAPHDCPQCGEPCYIPFGLNAQCVNYHCIWFDEETASGHRAEAAPPTDPTPCGLFRDFCSACKIPADFERWVHSTGTASAWCPHCGEPNYWTDVEMSYDVDDADTQPGITPGITIKLGSVPLNPMVGGGTFKIGGQDPPGYNHLDSAGTLLGLPRIAGESDDDYQDRLTAIYLLPPQGGTP